MRIYAERHWEEEGGKRRQNIKLPTKVILTANWLNTEGAHLHFKLIIVFPVPPSCNGAIMHAWIRVANMEKRYMGYHRQWETDCTVLTPRVGLCRQRCCCMLYRERKNGANRLCFVQRYFATEPQTQGRRRMAGRDASELSHRQEREQTTQTHFWFAKKLKETVAQWAAPKQHFIGYLSKKKQHTDSHTQVIAQRSKNVEMAKMKNLLFARAVTVTGEIPF